MNQTGLEATLTEALRAKSFSGVVSISSQGATLFEQAFGYADRSNTLENQIGTRFGIASGTKFLTALAIGKLIDAGKLSLSSKLSDCIAYRFPNYAPEITVGQLLNHTSGIPDYYDEEKITDFEGFALSVPTYALRTLEDYLPTFPDEPMKFAPGTRFSYCNGGYILLGFVIEAISGTRYQDFVTQEILQPTGMQRSGFFRFDQLPEHTASGYLEDATGWRTNIYNLPVVGGSDGGMFTTVHDLTRLWDAFLEGQIVSKGLVEQYTQPSVKAESEGENVHYGRGLWIRGDAAGDLELAMVGGDAGVSFKSSVNRAKNLRVTVVSNTTGGVWRVLEDVNAVLNGL
jgi:CubicO group peptidase (beta-lactamase class C family)